MYRMEWEVASAERQAGEGRGISGSSAFKLCSWAPLLVLVVLGLCTVLGRKRPPESQPLHGNFSNLRTRWKRLVNLIQQHEEVVKEIDRYYRFQWGAAIRFMGRSFIPANLVRYARIRGFPGLPFSRSTGDADRLRMHQELLDFLCSDEDKSSPFYRVVYSGPAFLHALSEHLGKKFPDVNWSALAETHRVRVDEIPRFRFRGLLDLAMFVLAVVTAFNLLENPPSLVLDSDSPWVVSAVAVFLYLVIVLALLLFQFRRRRKRLNRTGNIMIYMSIRECYDSEFAGRAPAPSPDASATKSLSYVFEQE